MCFRSSAQQPVPPVNRHQELIPPPRRAASLALLLGLALCAAGCTAGLSDVDRRVDRMMEGASAKLGSDAPAPQIAKDFEPARAGADRGRIFAERLDTVNPTAAELEFKARLEAQQINDRLNRLDDEAGSREVVRMDLGQALLYASRHSREFRFAEEEYVLAALRLLIERHLWGPRFFNETSVRVDGRGDDGFFDTSLRLVNEFRVTQRLPYGGDISARALARAVDDLHSRVSAPTTQSADLLLSANIPLLRGAGDVARASRVQAERELIYASRSFEQFRREFLFDITREFLDLVVRAQSIENALRQVESFVWLEQRSEAFVEDGRDSPIDLARARQDTLFARDSLSRQREAYRLAVDRFKLRIGMSDDVDLVIVRSDPGLPVPDVSLSEAVDRALSYRLDLQTRRDQVDDARRGVAVSENLLLPDLHLSGSVGVPTDPRRTRGGADFSPGDASFEGGVTFGLPLDRETERIGVRQAQIRLERAIREYERFRDSLAIETRSAVRDIQQAMFSLQIQEENVRVAERGQEAILEAPDRATARDRSEAVDRLLRARDQRDSARRDLQIAILRYLLNSGQLRVGPDGRILPLSGMTLNPFTAEEQPAPRQASPELTPELAEELAPEIVPEPQP